MKTLLITMLIICSTCLSSQSQVISYVKIKEHGIETGYYNGKNLKKTQTAFHNFSEPYTDSMVKNLTGEYKNILIYIHCWLGDFPLFHKSSLRSLKNVKNIDRIIAIEWHGEGLSYKWNYENAAFEGKKASNLLHKMLTTTSGNKYYLLCHSMGNSLVQGALKDLNKNEVKFEHIVLAGTDLDLNSFREGVDMETIANKLTVFTHRNDRILKLASISHRKKRMGQMDPAILNEFYKGRNITFINAADMNVAYTDGLSNHSYFKSAPFIDWMNHNLIMVKQD